MFEKRCYLCGGKLEEGRCTECGLDNTRIEKKTYRLNQSSSSKASAERSQIESTWGQHNRGQETQKGTKKGTQKIVLKNTGRRTYAPIKEIKTVTPVMKNVWKAIGIIVTMVILVSGVIYNMASQYEQDVSEDYESVTYVEEEDPYQFAERELSAEGEDYRIVLEPGEYRVGVHLPEGNYQVILEEGSGTVSVDDFENSIYLWQGIGTEEEYDELQEWIDVRLYSGAVLEVSGNLKVELTTSNARLDEMAERMANPLTESVSLKREAELTAGEDFPAGVYDIKSGGEWSSVRYEVPLYTDYGDDEMNFLSRSRLVSSDEIDSVYRNIVLPEGTKICSEDADVILLPSAEIETEDYDAYYDEYR